MLQYRLKNQKVISRQRQGYRQVNKDKLSEYNQEYKYKNKSQISDYNRKYRKENLAAISKREREYCKAFQYKLNAKANKRRATKLQATPNWLTQEHWSEINEWYFAAKDCEWLSNEPLQVDHIVPLKGKDVCGLHVPWNLQILTRSQNSRKGNRT